jgi:hypothetical protein
MHRVTPLLLIAALLSFWAGGFSAVWAQASVSPADELAQLEQRIKVLDGYVESSDTPIPAYARSSRLRAQDIYQQYVEKAQTITQKLLKVKADADRQKTKYSLQRLAAISHSLDIENAAFQDSLTHGEGAFESYQLIQQAVLALNDATQYWREANQTRPLSRGTAADQAIDDEVLKIKLEQAFAAIEQLKQLDKLRTVLDKNLQE